MSRRTLRSGPVRTLGAGSVGGSESTLDALSGPRRQKTPQSTGSALEQLLEASMAAHGLYAPLREYRFHPTRRWRVDFAWPAQRLAVEVEGGIYRGGGHTSVGGIRRDIDKANALTMLGWRLLRVHGDQVRSGEATALIAEALTPAPGGEQC